MSAGARREPGAHAPDFQHPRPDRPAPLRALALVESRGAGRAPAYWCEPVVAGLGLARTRAPSDSLPMSLLDPTSLVAAFPPSGHRAWDNGSRGGSWVQGRARGGLRPRMRERPRALGEELAQAGAGRRGRRAGWRDCQCRQGGWGGLFLRPTLSLG